MNREIRGSPPARTPLGTIAVKLHDNLLNMAENLEKGFAVTEERRRILHNLFEQVWDVDALETELPVAKERIP